MNIRLNGTKEEIVEAVAIRREILPLVGQAIAIAEHNGKSERADQKFLEVNNRTIKLLKHLEKVAEAPFWIDNFAGLYRYMEQVRGAIENAKAANETDAIELFNGYLANAPRDIAQRMWDKSKRTPDEVEELIKKCQAL